MQRQLPDQPFYMNYMDLVIHSQNYVSADTPSKFSVALDESIEHVHEVELINRYIPTQTVYQVKMEWGYGTAGFGTQTNSWFPAAPEPTLPARITTISDSSEAVIVGWDDVYTDDSDNFQYRNVYIINPSNNFFGAGDRTILPGGKKLRFVAENDTVETILDVIGWTVINTEDTNLVGLVLNMDGFTRYRQLRTEGIDTDIFWVFTSTELENPATVIRRQLLYPILVVNSISVELRDNINNTEFNVPIQYLDWSTAPYTIIFKPYFLHLRVWYKDKNKANVPK